MEKIFLNKTIISGIKSRYSFATVTAKTPIGVIAENEELIEFLEKNPDGKLVLPIWSRQLVIKPINGFKPLYEISNAGIDFQKNSNIVKLHWTGFIGQGTSFQEAKLGKDIELVYLVPTLRDCAEDVYTYHAIQNIQRGVL